MKGKQNPDVAGRAVLLSKMILVLIHTMSIILGTSVCFIKTKKTVDIGNYFELLKVTRISSL